MNSVKNAIEDYNFMDSLYNVILNSSMAIEATDGENDNSKTESTQGQQEKADNANATTQDKDKDKDKDKDANGEKKPGEGGTAGFLKKLDGIVKFLGEMIRRLMSSIQEKMAKLLSSGKTFKAELAKAKKIHGAKLNFKVRNYRYNYKFLVQQLSTNVNAAYIDYYNFIAEVCNKYSNVLSNSLTEEAFKTELDQMVNSRKGMHENFFTYVALKVSPELKDVENAGTFFNSIRSMVRGVKPQGGDNDKEVEPKEYIVASNDVTQAESFINSYDAYVAKSNDNIKKVKNYTNEIMRKIDKFKQAANSSNHPNTELSKMLSAYSKNVSFISSVYPFILSLLHEVLVSSRILLKNVYGY